MTSSSSTAARLLVLAATVVLALPVAASARDAMVTFKVFAPPETPADARLFISGNIPSLGPWDPGKVELGKIGDRTYAITLILPAGLDFQYKFTRGSWETVEKGRWFEEISDREHHVLGDETVTVRVQNWRDFSGEREMFTVVGDIRRHKDFPSRALGNTRSVLVYLPPGYDEDDSKRYPVLYMHDGQNLFDAGTSFIGVEWSVDETLERMIREKLVRPLIVVGIYNTGEREFEVHADSGRRPRQGRRRVPLREVHRGRTQTVHRLHVPNEAGA